MKLNLQPTLGFVVVICVLFHSASAGSSKAEESTMSVKQVELGDSASAAGACTRLVGGHTSILAAGRLYDRFLLLTTDLYLFEIHPDNYMEPSRAVPPYRVLTNSPPTHLSTRFPVLYPSFAADIARHILYGFTYSLNFDMKEQGVYRADYLAFVYLNESVTSTAENHCLFVIDYHSGQSIRPLCSKIFSTIQAISTIPLPYPILMVGYVRAGDQPQMLCGPEMREMAVLLSGEMMPPQNHSKNGGSPMFQPCMMIEECVQVMLFPEWEGQSELPDDVRDEFCTVFNGRFSAGFHLKESEVYIIDQSGTVHAMEDTFTKRVFVQMPLSQFIGCDVLPPWNFTFEKHHIIFGVFFFLVIQVIIVLFICYSLNFCGTGQQQKQPTPVKKVKKGKRSKKLKRGSHSSFGSKSEAMSSRSSRSSIKSSFSVGRKSFSAKKSSAKRSSISRGSSKMSQKSAKGRDSMMSTGHSGTTVSFSKRRSSVLEGTQISA